MRLLRTCGRFPLSGGAGYVRRYLSSTGSPPSSLRSSLLRRRVPVAVGACVAAAAGVHVSLKRWHSSSSSTAVHSSPPIVATHAGVQEWLSTQCVSFPVSSTHIRVLETPDEFYSTLMHMVSTAHERVLLSSLYLGTGPHEQKLVDALRTSMHKQPHLRVDVLLDYWRGTRPVGANKLSSVTALAPLMQSAESVTPAGMSGTPVFSSSPSPSAGRFALHLLQLPPPSVPHQISALRSWVERRFFTGDKTREAVGVHHMKFYVVDDNVLISGANLSDTYFTTRQDRYILIRDNTLARFYTQLMQRMQRMPFCHTLTHTGPTPAPKDMRALLQSHSGATEWQQRMRLGNDVASLFMPQAQLQPPAPSADTDTLIFPTLQMGTLGVCQDEEVTAGLFGLCGVPPSSSSVRVDVATGYMNLTRRYEHILCHAQHTTRILAAARDANGWWGATGGGRYVPDLYAAAATEFLHAASRSPARSHVQLLEWSRAGWSYHAKGMWVSWAGVGAANSSSTASTPTPAPTLTVIGSPNFGARSVQRDTETALVLLTQPHSPLAHALHHERQRVLQHCTRTTLDGCTPMGDDPAAPVQQAVPPPLWLRLLSRVARPYM